MTALAALATFTGLALVYVASHAALESVGVGENYADLLAALPAAAALYLAHAIFRGDDE